MNICKRMGSFWQRSCFSSCSGRCARLGSRKLLSVFFTVVLLFICAVPSFAADDDTLDLSTFSVLMFREVDNEYGGVTSTAYPCTSSESTIGGVNYLAFYSTSHDFYQSGARKVLLVFQNLPLRAGHEYELEFYTYNTINWGYDVDVTVNGTAIDELSVYTHYVSTTEGYGKAYLHSMRFQIPNTEGATNYSLSISYTVPANQSFGSGSSDPLPRFFIQKDPSLVDLDDTTGLLNTIIDWIRDLRDKIVNGFSNLASSIGNFFSSLGDRISGFFTDLWDNIKQKFDDLKQWFVDLGDRIQGFFVELYNDIVEGLKSLFIPSDGYFDTKKTELETFATEHFGALYQVPDLMVDTLRKFTSMSPEQPSITLPAIEFNFNGQHYVLSESITYSFSWVNDSGHMLYYFYKFYRGFVTVILFFSFANYCIKKYNEVFAGSDAE